MSDPRVVATRTRSYTYRLQQHADESMTLQQMQAALGAARSVGMPTDSSWQITTDPATGERLIQFTHVEVIEQ